MYENLTSGRMSGQGPLQPPADHRPPELRTADDASSAAASCGALVASMLVEVTLLASTMCNEQQVDLPDQVLADMVRQLSEVIERAGAVRSMVLAQADRRGVARAAGHVSTVAWLREQTRGDLRSCREQVRTARLLADVYPSTQSAWLAGGITEAHARAVARGLHTAMIAVEPEIRAEARSAAEATLLEISKDYCVDHANAAVKRIRAAVDPDGVRVSAMESEGKEYFKLTPVADGYVAQGWFSHLTGTKLATVLQGRRNSLFHQGEMGDTTSLDGDAVARDEAGDRLYPDDLSARHVYRQNAMVLGQIADELLTAGDAGVIQGERPHVEISISLDDFVNGSHPGELLLMGTSAPDNSSLLAGSLVRELSCDSRVRRVVTRDPCAGAASDDIGQPPDVGAGPLGRLLTAPSEVVDYGRAHRTVPAGLRRILGRRDRGCIYPGCTRPFVHTHGHHVKHWADGGETSLDNLASLCSTHHHLIHAQGYSVTPTPGKAPNQAGYWTIRPPQRE